MSVFLTYTTVGLVIGCIYALTATGLVVTYTTSGIFNFAHGALGMFAAYTYWQFRIAWHWPTFLALVFVLFVLAPVFGALIERILIRPLFGASVDLTVVVTLGLLLGLIGTANLIWKPTVIRDLPQFYKGKSFRLFAINITYNQVIVIIAAIAVAITLKLFFSRTRTGIAMRGVVDNPDLLAMAGGGPARIRMLSWALGTSLAALAGILIAPIQKLNILALTLFVVNGYAAAMIGRLKSLPMTIVGALLVGLGTQYTIGYASSYFLRQIQQVLPMLVLFVVIIVLPQERLRLGSVIGPRAPRPASLRTSVTWAAILVVGAVALVPHLKGSTLTNASTGMALATILLSLVLLTGYSGLTSLCQMTFAGVGAVAMAHVGHHGNPLGLVAAFLLAASAGAVVAAPTLKLRGLYLGLATLAFATALDSIFFTQVLGQGGSLIVDRVRLPLVRPTNQSYFILLAVIFAVSGVALLAVRRGRIGRQLAALDDSPAACATLGLNVNWTKLAVFTVSAGIAGVGGALLTAVPGRANTLDFFYLVSLSLLLILRVGGVNTVTGAFLGAAFLSTFRILQSHFPKLAALSYLLTGLSAVSLGRDPNGLGGRIAEGAAAIRRAWERRAPRSYDATPLVGSVDGTTLAEGSTLGEGETLAHV